MGPRVKLYAAITVFRCPLWPIVQVPY